MIKYLGSKRTLLPVLGDIAVATGAQTAADLFTGTTRVAQEFKRRGMHVTASDIATYSDLLARCFIATDARGVDTARLADVVADLNALPGAPGYFTRTFCEDSRYFQPKNGARIDAVRGHIADKYADDPLFPILMSALLLAADKVDSTAGVQMAYLKQWSARAHNDLDIKVPELLDGPGASLLGDITELVDQLPEVDLAYLDPPYNQHRYFTNYHVWESLVRWDEPEAYGIAQKRIDSRDEATKSVFNKKREMPTALHDLIQRVRAGVVVVSYNDESWVQPDEMTRSLLAAGHETVALLAFDSKRYVGAKIGIHNKRGEKVGTVGRLRNTEYVFVAGPSDRVEAARAAAEGFTPAN